jgi:hypothetical protein
MSKPVDHSPEDLQRAIDRVLKLQHRFDAQSMQCLCFECQAIRIVCRLAKERVQALNKGHGASGIQQA